MMDDVCVIDGELYFVDDDMLIFLDEFEEVLIGMYMWEIIEVERREESCAIEEAYYYLVGDCEDFVWFLCIDVYDKVFYDDVYLFKD